MLSILTGEKSSHEACKITGTPPSKNKTEPKTLSFVQSKIEISKYGYKTPMEKPFELSEKLEVSPTRFTPTPELDAWFLDDEDHFHCLGLIQNLYKFPVKRSINWLNNIFLQLRKFVNENNLVRVKVLTNMWLNDGNQHSFPVITLEDIHILSAKARLEKDFEFEELNKKYDGKKDKDIFSALNCEVSDLLSSPDRKSIVTSLKRALQQI